MAAVSSGKHSRPRKLVKGGTTSTRRHRFESFNQRVAKLNIDPIRRRRRNEVVEEDLQVSASYFKVSLDRWKDLNLSENFTSFIREVDPICSSLPLLLHHNNRIFDTLASYIEKRDSLSLEPLLDLLSNFAHDLGLRFEDHFSKAVTLVASLAAKHTDVEVIEWSFTCLAWLFKYLSRLLVPNLRPVFEIMAPLLGREPQKLHTTRFAAEAMSFLVRKAATVYVRDKKPLEIIIGAIREDLMQMAQMEENRSQLQLYQHGMMTLLLNAIKGIDRKLYSGATYIYSCMIDDLFSADHDQRRAYADVVFGITVAITHHSDAENFQPIVDVILEHIHRLDQNSHVTFVADSGHLLFIVATVRKGTRIQSWKPLLDAVLTLLDICNKQNQKVLTEIYKATAVILQSSPLDLVLPNLSLAMSTIASQRSSPQFLSFCNYFCDLGRQRFQDFLLPYFSKFIISKWQEHELELCTLIPKITGAIANYKVVLPVPWQEQIVKTFEDMMNQEDNVFQCRAYLDLMDCVLMTPATQDSIIRALSDLAHYELRNVSNTGARGLFTLGTGLRTVVHYSTGRQTHLFEDLPLILGQANRYGSLLPYLEAILLLIQSSELPLNDIDAVVEVLVEHLHSSSHSLRQLSLRILDALHVNKCGEHADVITTALAIENSPLDLQSARSISMHARKLASQYAAALSQEWLQKAVPHFCFGMLTYKLSQAWEDAALALKQICETNSGQEIVSSLAFGWLEQPELDSDSGSTLIPKHPQQGPLTDFECSNLNQVEDIISDDIAAVAVSADDLRTRWNDSLTHVRHEVANAPTLALRVLAAVPSVAEKRSRLLVPKFLSWAIDEVDEGVEEPVEQSVTLQTPSMTTPSQRLKRRDQKAMLELFGSFQNPKVLYRSSEVFEALRSLLTNGNVDIQRAALKAIFTWKLEEIAPYQENLVNLLDDARFRDELSTFINLDDQNSVIQDLHRPELMPVMLRLLYGRMIAGTSSGSKSQAVVRKAVLQALSRLDECYLQDFVQIALGRLKDVEIIEDARLNEQSLVREYISARKQVGLVNMLKDLLEVLGSRLMPFDQALANALLYCLVGAARSLQSQNDMSEQASEKSAHTSLLKVVRQTGLQCLNLLFRSAKAESLKPYVPVIFVELLSPRLDKLAVETAQSISGTLQLFATWASSQDSVFFLIDYDTRAITSVIDCLEVPSAKDDVKLFVVEEILMKLVKLSQPADPENVVMCNSSNHKSVAQRVLLPNVDCVLKGAGNLLRKSPSKELMGATIQLISILAPLVEGSSQVMSLLEICTFLLDQPSHRINPKSKGELLQIVQHFVPLIDTPLPADLQDQIFRTVSSLFGYFKDRANRLILSQVLSVLAQKDAELLYVALLCTSLNAFSTRRIDEPDFDQRLKAFNAINEDLFKSFTAKQWRPILYNMLYYVKDDEELAIRSNASFSLRRFVEVNVITSESTGTESSDMVKKILLPALRRGVSEPSELVRTEHLSIMAHLIWHNSQWPEVNDMSVLLANNDEEASFFNNVLHIQQHRRLRALRRLASVASQGNLRSANVAHFFIPLIEHFVFDKADDESAHNLSAETVSTVGALAISLEWPQFRAVFRRFSSYIQSKPDVEKSVIRLLGVIIDALAQSAETKQIGMAIPKESNTDIQTTDHVRNTLAITMPGQEKLADDLSNNLLPSLVKYLHDKDEATVSLRVPVAVSVVKLLKLLPQDQFGDRLPPVLTDVCHILRSRAQESRDLTRNTLVEISTLIGPSYFGFVLKELRSSLARGYQLHVLSFTVHSILVATSSIFKPGDLDYCLPQIVAIIMEDIFGVTGQEKDAEEYISKMKEVKSSKSQDSMELVARTAAVEHFVQLIRPLQALLAEKLDLRMVKKIDELLRRIGVGLLRNEAIQDQRVLIFCHEIIREVYKTGQSPNGTDSKDDYRTRRFLINYKGANKTGFRGSTSSYNHKLARFALDILRSVLQKYEVLQTPANLSGFIPIIGDAIVQPNEEIQTSGLRLLTTIIKVPLKAIDDNAAIYVAECVKLVKASTSTNLELAQAALKLVSAILRERRTVEIRETDLAYLLKRLIPDLEEPDKYGIAFNFLKAIMTRKIVITEVYEVLDAAAVIMVTNQTRSARDMARGAYFQFIMDYPQSKDRFSKQLAFLVRNLDYKHQEGRQSVIEAINLLFNKVGEDLVQDILATFFVPLVMVVVNDESSECREMAGALLKKAFERADAERTQSFTNLLRTWLDQAHEPLLVRAAFQTYGLYLDTNGEKAEKELSLLQSRLTQVLKSNLKDPLKAEWELLYFGLQTFAKICQIFPARAFAASTAPLWTSIRQCLSFPHAWVKLSSAKLLGTYFAEFARMIAKTSNTSLPFQGSNGLSLQEHEIVEIARSSLSLLHVPNLSSDLANQTVRNLLFLGNTMAQTSLPWPQKHQDEEHENSSSSDAESDPESPPEDTPRPSSKPALGHLITQTTRLLRRGPLTTRSPSLPPLHASLTLLAALTTTLPLPALHPHIRTLLLPLHNLTDPTIPAPFSTDTAFVEGYKSLVANAQEMMGVLQKRMGTTEYVNVMSRVREEVKGRREGRRVKRRIEKVREPERAMRVKRRKGERKKEKRKERSGEERGRRRGW